MNKINKKINKKGLEGSAFTWVGGALGLVLAVLLAYLLFGKSSTAINSVDVYSDFKDYDGDGKYDAFDDCPCGTDNVKQEINGKAKCLAGLTQAECACADSFANSAVHYAEKKRYKQEVLFEWDAQSGKCLYMRDAGCKDLLYAKDKKIPNTEQTISTCTTPP
jgi:hypothetical protein